MLEKEVSESATQIVEYSKFIAKQDRMKVLANFIQVYPNPAVNYVYIHYPQPTNAELIVYNTIGSIVKSEIVNNNFKVLLNDLSNGMYTYKLIIDKQNYFGKFTIKK